MRISRRWFQLHLSTAVVLMLVAGVLCGLNLRHRAAIEYVDIATMYAQGWPYDARTVINVPEDLYQRQLLQLRLDFSKPFTPLGDEEVTDDEVSVVLPWTAAVWISIKTHLYEAWTWTEPYRGGAADVGVALGILGGIAVVLEWRVRRSGANAPRVVAAAGTPPGC